MNGIDYLLDTNFILGLLKSAPAIEDEVIRLRRTHTIKPPDAIIAASALTLGAELLTHDQKLLAVMECETQSRVGKR